MQCCLCKEREALVHLTQIIDEKVVERIHLCEECAKEKGVNDPVGFSLADLLTATKKADPTWPDHFPLRIRCRKGALASVYASLSNLNSVASFFLSVAYSIASG
jgi:hypothetical protein